MPAQVQGAVVGETLTNCCTSDISYHILMPSPLRPIVSHLQQATRRPESMALDSMPQLLRSGLDCTICQYLVRGRPLESRLTKGSGSFVLLVLRYQQSPAV